MKINRKFWYTSALFGAAIIWGSSFFVVKNAVDVFPPNILLGFRFTIGALLLAIFFFKNLKASDSGHVWRGAVLGLCLYLGYTFQTIGITDTTPGKNAFLTAIYCIIVPFLYWFVDHSKPDRYNLSAALLCLAGIGMVSLAGDFTVGFGDGMTLIGGVFYAIHMVCVAKFSKGKDVILLTIYQFGFAAVFSWVVGLIAEPFPSYTSWSWGSICGLLYLAVFATAVALLLQNIGQKHTHPAAAALILSLESVFGVLFSVVFYGEELTVRLLIGFILIFIAIVVSETKLSFLHRQEKLGNGIAKNEA